MIRDLVNFVEASIPKLQRVWGNAYKEGCRAYILGEPRLQHGRRGFNMMWFKGWDDMKKKYGSRKNIPKITITKTKKLESNKGGVG